MTVHHTTTTARRRRGRVGRLALAALLTTSVALAGCSEGGTEETPSGSGAGPSATGAPQSGTADPDASRGDGQSASADALLAAHGLAGADARQVIDTLDAQPVAERPSDLIASVRPGQLLLSDGQGQEAPLPMPTDAFYLSVAPYVSGTHECFFHSLTTCRGELANTPVHVTVTDDSTGRVLVEEDMSTFDNGFVGLWLPRGIEATLTISSDGRSATTGISTSGDEDPTCLTTLELV